MNKMNKFRIQVYVGRGQGWRLGYNEYTEEQLVERLTRLQEVGIKYRVLKSN